MSKFHSIVSRREFMTGLGLAGAGVGAASFIAGPNFHDMDELIGSGTGRKRPWYYKERELGNPTVDIDWNLVQRFDGRYTTHTTTMMARYLGLTEFNKRKNDTVAILSQYVKSNEPGYTLRDNSLYNAGYSATGMPYWVGPSSTTPAQQGVPNWQGTPEENLSMLRAFMAFFGANDVFAMPLDTNGKKLVATHGQGVDISYLTSWPPPNSANRETVFENVDAGYATTDKAVIPSNHQMYIVTYSMQMASDPWRSAPSLISARICRAIAFALLL